MKRNPHYQLKYISGTPYLIAFGQATAEFKQDIQLNESSMFLWNHFEEVSTAEELAALYAREFSIPSEEFPTLETSIDRLIASFYHRGILIPDNTDYIGKEEFCTSLAIAGLTVKLYGARACFVDDLFAFEYDFDTPASNNTQEISVQTAPPPYNKTGRLLLQSKELTVLEGEDRYYLLFPSLTYIKEAHISFDGRHASIYCKQAQTEECKQETFSVMATLFMYFASKHNMIIIHSASILYKDKAWLFAAASGIGKTTHTNLWQEFAKTPLINGDLNLISIESGKPAIHGIPWCGSSGIYDSRTYDLGGIILLKQAPTDECVYLTDEQKILSISHRNISPAWTCDMQDNNIKIIERIYSDIFVCSLNCTPTQSAVTCIQNAIDTYLT